MKTLLLPAALAAASLLPLTATATAPSSPTGSIRVVVTDMESTGGMVGVALFTSDKGFPDKPEKAMRSTVRRAGSDQCEFIFEGVPCGTYAVSVLHDENGNGKMDKTFIGIPKEGFGVSNNPRIKYGPPSFDDARFDLGEAVELSVAMNYFRSDKEEKE